MTVVEKLARVIRVLCKNLLVFMLLYSRDWLILLILEKIFIILAILFLGSAWMFGCPRILMRIGGFFEWVSERIERELILASL